MSSVTVHNYGATAHFTVVPQHTIMVPLHSECIFISVRTSDLKPQHTRGQNTKPNTDIYAASFSDALTPVQTVV
jgi:hypothetical protein